MVGENYPGWRIGQLIQVTCRNSRHFGRCGVITQVCNVRLKVVFEGREPGSFVDKSRASPVELPHAARAANRPWERAREVESDGDEDSSRERPWVDGYEDHPWDRPYHPWDRSDGVDSNEDDDGAPDHSQILEQLAFTAAALIASHENDAARVQRELSEFTATVGRNTRDISRQHRRHRRHPSPGPYPIIARI
jgi:hypothetical protein